MRYSTMLFAVHLAALTFVPSLVTAQQTTPAAARYPSKPIRVLLPSPPGSGGDLMMRGITQKLAGKLGQPFLVDNRAGAAGQVGLEMLANAAPDGYTIATLTSQNVAAMVVKTISVDIPNVLSPIVLMISQPYIVVAAPDLPVSSIKELVAMAKTKPLAYASSGIGSIVHLGMEMVSFRGGIKMTHVPYKGAADMLTDLMSGRVQVAIINPISAKPFVTSGKIKALAVTSPERAKGMPDVPTVAESLSGYELLSWYGLVGPKALPSALIRTLNQTVTEVMMSPEVKDKFASEGADSAPPNSPAEFRALVAEEIKRWDALLKSGNIKLD